MTTSMRSQQTRHPETPSTPGGVPILFSCEHGGHEVPPELRPLFRGCQNLLRSHRGWDRGALAVAKLMAVDLDAPLHFETVSRLVIELNRSADHPQLFSELTRDLEPGRKQRLIEEIYLPYRQPVESALERTIRRNGRVVHIGVHSFTPELKGKVRDYDIGLLFDPRRKLEKSFCDAWRSAMRRAEPGWRVRHNLPYRGTSDGFTTYLRTRFVDPTYAGIELEMRNDLIRTARAQRGFARIIASSLREAACGDVEGPTSAECRV